MKIGILAGLLLILGGFSAFSQNKSVTIALSDKEKLLTTLDLGDAGIVIKTGKATMNSKDLDWKLKYYSKNLELNWEVPLQTLQTNTGIKSPLVATASGSYVYHREVNNAPLLTQVSRSGELKTYPLASDKEVNHIFQVFCDETYLYFLSAKGYNRMTADKKMLKERLIFKRIRHSDFEEKNFLIELPLLTSHKTQGFWNYVGHSSAGIYLMSPSISVKEQIYKYDIITVNAEGKVINSVSIDLSLEKGKHLRPSGNYVISPGNYQYDVPNFSSSYSNYRGYQVRIKMRMDYIDAFGGVVVDDIGKAIYIYGLYGPEAFKRVGSKYEGYFIGKYDLQGKELWKVQQKAPGHLATQSYFTIHGTPEGRSLALRILEDELKFQIFFKSEVHSFELDFEGNVLAYYKNKFSKETATSTEAKMAYSSPEKIKSVQYMVAIDPKKVRKTFYLYFKSSDHEILLLDKRSEEKIELHQFELPN